MLSLHYRRGGRTVRITRWISVLSGALVVLGAFVVLAGSARADDSIFDGLIRSSRAGGRARVVRRRRDQFNVSDGGW